MTAANESGSLDRLPRAGWISARARNASRRGWRIALVGGLALLITALLLVFLPRGADRAVRAQLDRLAPPIDTIALLARLELLAAQRGQARRADSLRADSAKSGGSSRVASPADRPADSTAASSVRQQSAASAPSDSRPTTPALTASVSSAPEDSTLGELRLLLQRARDVPLAESYRALAQARALRADRRALALADSIETLHREREAYAALGGADARYAAMTTQLAALGQRLVRLAAVRLRDAQRPVAAPGSASIDSAATTPTDSASDSNQTGAAAVVALTPAAVTAAREDEREREDAVRIAEENGVRTQLAFARRENARRAAREQALEARLSRSVPPAAVLLAALVVGASLGYASAMLRELRQPTVSDDTEVERLTATRVISASPVAPRRRGRSTAERSVRDDANAAYPLVHLALTGIGEVARAVQIVAESRTTAVIVAVQVGVVAAAESRAVAIVDLADEPAVVTPLLRERYRLTVPTSPSPRSSRRGERTVTTVMIDRDLAMDVRRATASSAPETDAYDLTLMPQDAVAFSRDPKAVGSDLIVCVRLGETPLAWLSAVVRQASVRGDRVRAVLLFDGLAPGQ